MSRYKLLESKLRIVGKLRFETAFHIGSGREGELATDMGVLKDVVYDEPILPGSTLKGSFRASVERLAAHLDLRACLLDSNLSGVECVSDQKYEKKVRKEFSNLSSETDKVEWLRKHTCDVCMLFGSPMQSSRISFGDGALQAWAGTVQVRDGVCLDRDSETARHGAKYDFEVVPAGAMFEITIDLENPQEEELALVRAGLAEWENGFRVGGFTSRGLGRARLTVDSAEQVRYSDPEQLRQYLLHKKMQPVGTLLDDSLTRRLNRGGGQHAQEDG